jgi:hypothetical protein
VPRKTTGLPITIREDEAIVIKDVTARVLGHESMASICRDLNARGIRTARGNAWDVRRLRDMLACARISGRREYIAQAERKTVTGTARVIGEIMSETSEYPAIISAVDSDALRAMLSDDSRDARKSKSTARKMLSGRLVCGRCGERMLSRPQKGVPAYQCVKRLDGRGCGKVSVHGGKADAVAAGAVKRALMSPDFAERLAKVSEVDPGTVEAIHADENMLQEINADRTAGLITRGEWLAMRATVEARLTTARAAVQRTEASRALAFLLVPAHEVAAAWEAATDGQRRAAIDVLVDRWTVLPAAGVGYNVPDRMVEPTWLM